MTDITVGIEHSGAGGLDRYERRLQVLHFCFAVAADHPGVDSCVARRNLNLWLGGHATDHVSGRPRPLGGGHAVNHAAWPTWCRAGIQCKPVRYPAALDRHPTAT